MTGGGPDLSVLVVNYRTGEHLRRCLDSLEARRGPIAVETIVVDNDSGDGSEAAARGRTGVTLVVNPRNVLLSPAWNQAARLARAPWLLFLNPDTEIVRGTLADLVALGRAAPRAGIVGPMLRNADGTVYPSGRPFPRIREAVGHAVLGSVRPGNRFTRRYHLADWDRTTPREVDWVSGACMLMPRAAYDAVGGFDESFALYAEELDVATRLRDAGWTVRFEPSVEVLHIGAVSTGRSRRTLRMHSASVFRYYRKHRARGWRRLTLPLAWAFLRLRAEVEGWRT
ncbi:MAG: glycosyltransferase family 2 protein [Actinomycetota bacterium]